MSEPPSEPESDPEPDGAPEEPLPVMDRLERFWLIVKTSVVAVFDARLSLVAAGLSFFALLAVAPILVFAVLALGMFFGPEGARDRIYETLLDQTSPEVANYLIRLVDDARDIESGVLAATIGLIFLIYSSTRLFKELKEALDLLWGTQTRYERFSARLLDALKARALALGTVFVVALVLLLLIGSQVLISGAAAFISEHVVRLPIAVWKVVELAFAFALLTSIFLYVLRTLPDRKLPWRPLIIGSAFTAALFLVGRWLIALYLTKSAATGAYGAAGITLVVLLWFYYSALAFLAGAKVTHAVATADRAQSPFTGGSRQ